MRHRDRIGGSRLNYPSGRRARRRRAQRRREEGEVVSPDLDRWVQPRPLVRTEVLPDDAGELVRFHNPWSEGVLDAEAVDVDEVAADRDAPMAVLASDEHGHES